MDPRPNFPQLEEEMLLHWKNNEVFKKSLAKSAPKGDYIFFEGPPTANGMPGIHHLLARSFKDVMPRFKTMQGFHVARKAGWDTHGLPVELQVEKELGFNGKPDIEKYGVKEYNQKCKESVWVYKDEWEKFTERSGFWLDMEKPYVTYENNYMESVWWVVSEMWKKNLVYKGYKVVPYCPRCGTPLSSHEVAQGYKDDTEDPAVTVKFKVKGKANEFFLAWTTTPWTLPANLALAVGKDLNYDKVEVNGQVLILAQDRVEVITPGAKVLERVKGSDLLGMEYEPLYSFVPLEKKAHFVVAADFVSTGDGTGIVHIAPMYGEDDFQVGIEHDLPQVHIIDARGHFIPAVAPWTGMFIKKADPHIIAELESRGLLYEASTIKHTYPFCWRCDTPLVYFAIDSWYIAMRKLRDQLLANNETIHWVPETIKDGRFGEWLRGVKDWAISRRRYWATPLPVWTCGCGNQTCIGSIAELKAKAKNAVPEDLHRPFIDEVILKCDKCAGDMKRETDLLDVWFDSGAMPFAQHHYPFENKEALDKSGLQADYICEAVDQTRGWFYTLLAISTALGLPAPYKNVICLGHINDKFGKKMSKSKGNIVKPYDMFTKYGADAVRQLFYTMSSAGEPKRFDEKQVDDIVKKQFMILWNVVSFRKMYGASGGEAQPVHEMDKWILNETAKLVDGVTANLEKYEIVEAARMIGPFVTELSTWYVRRSRDRMKGDEASQVTAVLDAVLMTLVKLMSPFTPFLADYLYQQLGGKEVSVHLDAWPVVPANWRNETVEKEMKFLRTVVTKALEARATTKIPIRQVLAGLTVNFADIKESESFGSNAALLDILKDEVNVEDVEVFGGDAGVDDETGSARDVHVELDTELTPELLAKGAVRELTRTVNSLRKDLGLTVADRVTLYVVAAGGPAADAVKLFGKELMLDTRSSALEAVKAEVEKETVVTIGENEVWVGIKKM
jgi:isoleucyl-tRNA synthetase